jgi:hypothetical protein
VLQEQLHAALDARGIKESALAERRNVLEAAAGELRNLDEQRLRLEQGLSPVARQASATCGSRPRRRSSTRSSTASASPKVRVVSEADELPFARRTFRGWRR